jgi:hypothetical protein
MRLITVVKKNIVLLVILALTIGLFIYFTLRKEGFQTPVVGNSCRSATDIINGRCDNTFTFNTNTNRCEKNQRYCENQNEFVLSSSREQCIKKSDTRIKIPSLSRLVVQNPPNYKCDNEYVRIGNFRCAKSGKFVCPSGFPQRSSGICSRCSHLSGFIYSDGQCKNRDNPAIRVPADTRPPICSA